MKNIIIGIVVFMGFLGAGYTLRYYYIYNELPGSHMGNKGEANDIADFSKARELVGASTNVFVGKVQEIASREPRFGDSETQFRVKVIANIKGALEDSIILRNYRDSHLIQLGSTYVFAVRGNADEGYTLNQNKELSSLISSNQDLTENQLAEIAYDNERVQELLVAYVYEKVPVLDIRANLAFNTYESLSQEQKDSVLNKIKNLPPPPPALFENTRALCTDKIDNDEDHFVDLSDFDCEEFLPPPVAETTRALCSDGLDNDRKNGTDLVDPSCGFLTGPENTASHCSDNLDNDRDGYKDSRDKDCVQYYLDNPAPATPGVPSPSTTST